MGMPFHDDQRPAGVVGFFVRIIITLIEVAVRLALLPIKAVSSFASTGFVWLLRLPFRLLGIAAQLVGVLLVIALIMLVIVAVFTMVAA
jgi:hypothetical protein